MRLLALDDDLVSTHVLDARHNTNGLGLLFEHRPLFDVHFKGGLDWLARQRRVGRNAGALQFVAHADPGAVGQTVRRGERQASGPYRRAHHRHRKAAALLVAPQRQLDGMLGRHLMVVEGFDHFEPGQHPIHAVEFTPCRLSVEMTPGHDDRQRVFTPWAPEE